MARSSQVLRVGALHAVVVALVAASLAARANIEPARLLVAGGRGCDNPAWSPDGTRIAYRQHGGPRSHPALYVANADGSKPRELVPPLPLGGPLAWSPDSSRIAYSLHWSAYQIHIVRSDGFEARPLPSAGGSYVLAWSPADNRLLYSAQDSGIYSINPDGSGPRLVSTERGGPVALLPGGRTFAYRFRRDDNDVGDLRLQPIDGSAPTDLMALGPNAFGPTWSPDGAWIAFVSHHEGSSHIFAARADGSDRTQVTRGDARDGSPAWSPDGRRIAFVRDRDGQGAIFVVDVSQAFPDAVVTLAAPPRATRHPEPRPNMYVLSVGVSGAVGGATAAPNAANDAMDFADACRAQAGGYYSEVVVRVLTDEAATARAIRRGLLWLRTETGDGDTAICLLSGEGLRDKAGDPYVRAYDTDTSRVASTAVPGSDIDRLIGATAGTAVVLADLGDPTLLANQGFTDREVQIHRDYARRELTTPFVLYAVGETGGHQRRAAQPERRNGVFVEALLAAMAGPGDRDDNGLLSLNELAAHVHDALDGRWSESHASKQSGRGWLDIRLFEAPSRDAGQ